MNQMNTPSWFEKNPVKTWLVISLAFVLLFEAGMHLMYWTGLLPNNIIYMTQLEKTGYKKNINRILHEDGIPRRAEGLATYTQRGIPAQFIEFDGDGMRLDSYQGRAGEDTIIGVFGDSYTDALQVGQTETYTAITETRLRSLSCKVDFRNYGLGATGTSVQYLRYKQLKESGARFDHVIVTMFLGNDILNNHPVLDRFNVYKTYPYLIALDGKLQRKDIVMESGTATWQGIKDFFRNYSHVANTIFNLREVLRARKQIQALGQDGIRGREDADAELYNVYRDPVTSQWKEAWGNTEAIIKAWRQDTESSGEKFLLVLLTESLQIDPAFGNPLALDLDYPNRRLARFASEQNIDYLDFLPYARAKVANEGLRYPFFSWEHDGHYSQLGHRSVSDMLMDFFGPRIACAGAKRADNPDRRKPSPPPSWKEKTLQR